MDEESASLWLFPCHTPASSGQGRCAPVTADHRPVTIVQAQGGGALGACLSFISICCVFIQMHPIYLPSNVHKTLKDSAEGSHVPHFQLPKYEHLSLGLVHCHNE
jgi:hypothetical protein